MNNISADSQAFLRGLFDAAVAAVSPMVCLPPYLPIPPRGRTVVIGAGKAAAAMAAAVEAYWPAEALMRLSGMVITRYGHSAPTRFIRVVEAGHPLPDIAGEQAANNILALVRNLTTDDLVLCLISGGGSALLASPAPGLLLSDEQAINRALLKSGANIHEINCVRKHLSAIKGGRLALVCAPARVVTLAISDIPGNDPSAIASGPTVADPTTRQQALAILSKYRIETPEAVHNCLASSDCETPKPGDPRLAHSETHLIATGQQALQAAARYARTHDVTPLLFGDSIEGEARDVAYLHAAIARQIVQHGGQAKSPRVILSGGETTVTVRGPGRGGRSTEFLLALASMPDIFDMGVSALACDTDGIDGTEDNAGAWFGPDMAGQIAAHGLLPADFLARNDSYSFFLALNRLIVTGPTRTNVNDFRAIYLPAPTGRILGYPTIKDFGTQINKAIPGTGLNQTLEDGNPQPDLPGEANETTLLTKCASVTNADEIMTAVAVFEDIASIKELKKTLEETRTSVEVLETILNNTYDGILLVDAKGIITRMNRAYLDFLGISEAEAVGKHVTAVVENTRMHHVVETGIAEIGRTQKIRGKEMVVMRIPILKNGEVVGAVGKVMFRDVRELKSLAENLNLIEGELKYYKTELHRLKGAKYTFENIIGNSEKILKAKQLAKQASASDSTVLIYGESGTGKEIFAHAIHNYSYRHFGTFVRVNCGAIPGTLFESELFGYEQGAFTGAQKGGKPGKFELANSGTIFLDEIGELPLEMQVKLLRVLQEREIERVGGTKLIPLDVRVIAASNRPLEELVKEKKFREDLFYRLNIFRIELPPLREIPTDLPLITRHIISDLNESLSTKIEGLSEEVMKIFKKYAWPGNIRELRNVLERTIIINRQGEIKKTHIPLYLLQNELHLLDDFIQLKKDVPLKLDMVVQEAEKAVILKALELTNNNRRQAALLLGIHRSALYQKLKKFELKS